MGDFNSKLGKVKIDNICGGLGLGEVNDRGSRLIEFCADHEMYACNTWFKHHARRLYTWKSPGDNVRNQIDYILINQRFKNSVKQAKTYPGADCASDHNPVVVTLEVRLKVLTQKEKSSSQLDFSALRQADLQTQLAVAVDNRFTVLSTDIEVSEQSPDQNVDVEDMWSTFKSIVMESAEMILPKRMKTKKQKWMTEEIIEMMAERKAMKGRNQEVYDDINRRIQVKCNEAKEAWMNKQCEEIEQLQACHNYSAVHKKVKEVTNKKKGHSNAGCVKDRNGNVLFDGVDIASRWTEYINELFEDAREAVEVPEVCNSGPSILEAEVQHALEKIKTGKAVGPDGMSADILKAMGDIGLKKLTDLCNAIYDTGHIPEDMRRSVFVALPKKPKATECKDHRTISLMSHVLKVLLKVIEFRLKSKMDPEISDAQFGFRDGVGTRDAIFSLRNICERSLEVNQDVYICFIDYEKAFDRVQHSKLITILQEIGLDDKDIRIIRNLYWEQQAGVRINGDVPSVVQHILRDDSPLSG